MNPFYFGSRRRRLFGIYHPPRVSPVRSTGIVICPPLFLEAMRVHRTLAQLAVQLSGEGFHVLRFDYHGTGDSGGDGEEETLDGWLGDARAAVRELGDLAGITRTTLLGVRFGAVVATKVARGVGNLDDLVMWDPVTDGSDYLRWLHGRSRLRGGKGPSVEDILGNDPLPDQQAVVGVDGFAAPVGLLKELGEEALMRFEFQDLPIRRVVVAGAEAQPHMGLSRWLERNRVSHLTRTLPDEAGWEDPDRQGSMVLAPGAIRAIVDCIASETE